MSIIVPVLHGTSEEPTRSSANRSWFNTAPWKSKEMFEMFHWMNLTWLKRMLYWRSLLILNPYTSIYHLLVDEIIYTWIYCVYMWMMVDVLLLDDYVKPIFSHQTWGLSQCQSRARGQHHSMGWPKGGTLKGHHGFAPTCGGFLLKTCPSTTSGVFWEPTAFTEMTLA